MRNLVGGTGADGFAIADTGSLAGSINGGGGAGVNTLNLSARTTAADFGLASASSGTASGVTGGYTNVTTLVGNAAISTLTGTNTGSTYTVSGANSGTVNDGVATTTFSGVRNLVGGTGADGFAIADTGSLAGSINGGGGAGVNTLNLSARTAAADFGLASASSGTASGVTGGYTNVTTLVGNAAISTLTGTNTGSTYTVSGANSGTVNDGTGTTTFSGMRNLVGGTGADGFAIADTGSLAGSINGGGGAGVNTLNLSARTTAADFGLTSASSGTASGITGAYSNVATLKGNGTTSTLTGSATGSTFTASAANAGTVNDGVGTTNFSGVRNLVGRTGNDSFVIGVDLALASVDGGGGANSLMATSAATENLALGNTSLTRSASSPVALANINSATLNGGSGNNTIDASAWTGGRTVAVNVSAGTDSIIGNGVGTTLIGTPAASTFNLAGSDSGTVTSGVDVTTFSGVGNLTGGAGNDVLVIQNAGTLSGSLDGGGGLNTLDLSNKASATIVFNTGSSNSVNGVGIVGRLRNIGALIGNGTNTSLQGDSTGQSFAITANNEITVDGTQIFRGVANLDEGTGANSISGTTFKLAGNIIDAGGTTTLSGTIRTDGSQTYSGPVSAGSVTLVGLGGISATNPLNDFGSVSLTGGALDVHDVNAINLTSVTVGAASPLSITAGGTITLNGNVSTAADQHYNGNVLLATNSTLDAGGGHVAIVGNLDGGGNNATLASTAATPGAVSISGQASGIATFNVNGNATLGSGVLSTGTQTYTGALAFTSDATLDAGAGKVDMRSTVDGAGHALVVHSSSAAADAVHVGGIVSNVSQLTLNGASTIGANVSTTGSQLYAGPVTLAADAIFDAGAATIALQGGLSGATHTLTLDSTAAAANAITSGAAIGGVATFNANGNTTLTGGVTSSANQIFSGTLTLAGDATLAAGAGKVDLRSTVDGGGHSLVTKSTNPGADAIHVGGAISNMSAFTANGAATLGANVTTSGSQTYSGSVTLSADSTLAGSAVSFGSSVDGAFNLAVQAGATTFAGPVGATTALASLTTDAAGTTQVGANVSTTGAQTYNDKVALIGDSVMAASTLAFNGAIDGPHALAVSSGSPVTFAGAIGAAAPLASFTVNGASVLDGGSVSTAGAQSYVGATQLGTATTLTGTNLAFGNTVDGAFALTLNGASSFAGAVGGATPLAGLVANGAVQLSGAGLLKSSAIALNGPVSGAADLQLQTNALSGGASIAGSGTLTIDPIDPTLSIGVAGGNGSLQVSQALLSGASGFTSHVIGRTDGSGAISVGNLNLKADTTLQSASGSIDLVGTVDGPFALALNSGGATTISQAIGATTPLKSLSTDAAGTTSISGTVNTTGAQVYNDATTTNGTVGFVADSLQLQNASGDLLLGTLTLANGGAITTNGVIHLTGALQLNGGTLVVTSNAPLVAGAPNVFNDPDLTSTGKIYTFTGIPLNEAGATIVQDAGATLGSATGSLLSLRSPNGGSLLLSQPGNNLLGQISAVSGTPGDTNGSRFTTPGGISLGFIRIVSSQVNVAGAPPANHDPSVAAAGLEGDVIKITSDLLTTGPDGLIRARLPFSSLQGASSSLPALTFVLTPTALENATPPSNNSFGGTSADTFVQIEVGNEQGGFITARPLDTPGSGSGKVIFVGGSLQVRPFYDNNGNLTEIRLFYNGDAPRTPQEAGALAAVTALIEEARHQLFEQAVRTENVSARLRSGVIAEVGAGRPATVGRESIRLPDTCDLKPGTLLCE